MSDETKILDELIKFEAKSFEEHLSIEDNMKILFSGKFGKGKSTFLAELFKRQEEFLNEKKEKYKVIHISPVSYSIATNEDIINYIKYDVLFELLRKNVDVESYDFNNTDTIVNYVRSNKNQILKDVFKKIIDFIPKVGKALYNPKVELYGEGIKSFVELISEQYEKLEEHTKNLNDDSSSNKLTTFMDYIEGNKYSIYENDITTAIIEDLIESIKDKKAGDHAKTEKPSYNYETVLIIDDLDRIDPEHIFRILNVFSAHFEPYERFGKLNKFGFNKIILVCDIANIRSIFRHKYGGDVDFSGYIDKFYSKEIYYFRNYDGIRNVVERIIMDINVQTGRDYKQQYHKFSLLDHSIGLLDLISPLIDNNMLSLRSVIKLNGTLKFDRSLSLFKKDDINTESHVFHIEVRLLHQMFNSYSEIEKSIKKLRDLRFAIPNHSAYFKHIIYITSSEFHQFKQKGEYKLSVNGKNFYIETSEFISTHKIESFKGEDHLKMKASFEFNPSLDDYYESLLKLLRLCHTRIGWLE